MGRREPAAWQCPRPSLRLVAVVALCLLGGQVRAADRSVAVFEAFGLLGVWSMDCSQKASKANPFVSWTVTANGGVEHRMTFDAGWLAADFQVVGAAIVAPGLIRFRQIVKGRVAWVTTIAQVGAKMRTMSFSETSGRDLVRDGASTVSGAPTRLSERCDTQTPIS